MNKAANPFETLIRLWIQGATTCADAACNLTGTALGLGSRQGTGGARPKPQELARRWNALTTRIISLQQDFFGELLRDAPNTCKKRMEAQSFSQLGRMAKMNWEQESRRLSQSTTRGTHRLQQADVDRLHQLTQSMLQEYLSDLGALKPESLLPDVRPLADAWTKWLSGVEDDKAQRIVERFVQTLAVKVRHGAEFFADPDNTPVGPTPRELIHSECGVSLFRYLPPKEDPAKKRTPVLLVYSVINHSYILDLEPGYSFVEHLLSQDCDVYLVEWAKAEPGDRTTTLDGYIDPGLRGCVRAIRQRTGAQKIPMLGHCIGGNIALMYAALYPEDVSRLLTLTTPAVSSKKGIVALWTNQNVLPIDQIIDTYGLMPAKLIRYTFIALKPYNEVIKWKMFYENLGNDAAYNAFLPVDRWANENVDIPGEVFRKFIKDVFHGDRFSRGECRINGEQVDLKRITCPYLNLAATQDWIVSLDSARLLNDLVGSTDNRFEPINSVHVGIMYDPTTRPLWTNMSDFLTGRS